MYAIVEFKGNQYKAEKDAVLEVSKLDAKDGDVITIDTVLLVSDGDKVSVGSPYVKGAKVTVKGYDALTDQEVTIVARGFTAICLQHELDHFEGVLYYDHFNKEDPKAPIPNAMVIE